MTPDPLYIGIDLGTSGCRAVAIDGAGVVQGTTAVALPPPLREAGHIVQPPELWWAACQEALSGLFAQIPARKVRAIAVDGTSGTVLVTDAVGTPLAPASMYNDLCAETAARIGRVAPRDSGAHGASAGLAKLLYLLERVGAGNVRYCLNQADWIAARLCGRYGVSDENNCLKLGYDPRQRHWPPWMQALGIDTAILPDVVAPGTAIGPIQENLATAFGVPSDTRIVAGTTDSIAAFIATGATRPGEAVTSLGSTLVLKIVSQKPIFAPEQGVYSHRLGELWLAGGASNSGGAVLRRYFSQQAIDAMTPKLRAETPTGLDFYPLPGPGERFPVDDPDFAPRLTPRPEDDVIFFQAMLEGIASIEQQGYRLLHHLGAPEPINVRSAGGGARNAAWTAIRGRLLGVPMLAAKHQDAAYGAALLARQPDAQV